VASTCNNTAGRIPFETIYTPLCSSSTACSTVGTPNDRNCTAGGATCSVDGNRAVRLTYTPACNAGLTACQPNGQQSAPTYCDSVGITCTNNVANLPANSCTNGVCNSTPQTCVRQTISQCASGNVQIRSWNGLCVAGTGCQVQTTTNACPQPFCGASDGVLLHCPGGCITGPNGPMCNSECTICRGRCVNNTCIASVTPTPGGIITPTPGGILVPGGTVAPGAGLVSQ
jgi:hypothetical protein